MGMFWLQPVLGRDMQLWYSSAKVYRVAAKICPKLRPPLQKLQCIFFQAALNDSPKTAGLVAVFQVMKVPVHNLYTSYLPMF